MADCCEHDHCAAPLSGQNDAIYRRVLWAGLALNGGMFVVEVAAGLLAGSASLQADALDFLGDAANYGLSLFVVGMALRYLQQVPKVIGGVVVVGDKIGVAGGVEIAE